VVEIGEVPTKTRLPANVEAKEMQFLYKESDEVVFMDPSNHEQIAVSKLLIGDGADLMTDNLPCRMDRYAHARIRRPRRVDRAPGQLVAP
jgi:translation elongation factor P/translation initiation factor 5A